MSDIRILELDHAKSGFWVRPINFGGGGLQAFAAERRSQTHLDNRYGVINIQQNVQDDSLSGKIKSAKKRILIAKNFDIYLRQISQQKDGLAGYLESLCDSVTSVKGTEKPSRVLGCRFHFWTLFVLLMRPSVCDNNLSLCNS